MWLLYVAVWTTSAFPLKVIANGQALSLDDKILSSTYWTICSTQAHSVDLHGSEDPT